jgi:pimeloyl-ACP methyl ester carboxylesterase
LLLVHGAGGSHLVWPDQLRRLPDTSVLALDLPGHGRSSPPGRDSIRAYADVIAALINALDLEKVVIMGHSMGGAIALDLALRELTSLCGLVLIGTGARLRVTPAILGQLMADFATTVELIVQHSWCESAPEGVVAAGRSMILKQDPAVLHADFNACNEFDVMQQLDRIQLPTLVISGGSDLLAPAKYGQYLSANIHGAVYAEIEGGGHMMALEQPERVASAVASFLDELNAGRDSG